MEEEKKLTLKSLESDLLDELNDRKEEIVLDQYGQDTIQEIIDGVIPVYNSNLLDVVQSDLWIGDTEVIEGRGENTPFGAIKAVLFDHLQEQADNWLEDAKLDIKEQLEDKIMELKDWKLHFNGGNDTPEYKLKNQELEDTESKLKDWQEIHG